MSIRLYHIVSDVHNEGYIDRTLDSFIRDIEAKLGNEFKKTDLDEINNGFTIIFVKSGGVEGRFMEIYEKIKEPYLILASGMHNSLAASIEILSFLRQKGKRAEIIHGSPEYIASRIDELYKVHKAMESLKGLRLGVVGKPSDWLIASNMDRDAARSQLGIEIMDIDMKELMDEIDKTKSFTSPSLESIYRKNYDKSAVDEAARIYGGFKSIVDKYKLKGITVRCFDLLGIYKSTGCLGTALLNDEGVTAGCEGDVPALVSMVILNHLTKEPAFMANPSSIDMDKNSMILAHCTLPLCMADEYSLDTHFESGMGVGIRGRIREGRSTVFKVSQDLKSYFASGADILENLSDKNLCRTQIRIKLDKDAGYFLQNPLGNHHIVCRGDYSNLVDEFFRQVK